MMWFWGGVIDVLLVPCVSFCILFLLVFPLFLFIGIHKVQPVCLKYELLFRSHCIGTAASGKIWIIYRLLFGSNKWRSKYIFVLLRGGFVLQNLWENVPQLPGSCQSRLIYLHKPVIVPYFIIVEIQNVFCLFACFLEEQRVCNSVFY